VHLAGLELEREKPVVREEPLVESVVHRAAVAQCPQGFAALVDNPPRGAGPRPHPDKPTDDEAPALPLPKQHGAQTSPDMAFSVNGSAHQNADARLPPLQSEYLSLPQRLLCIRGSTEHLHSLMHRFEGLCKKPHFGAFSGMSEHEGSGKLGESGRRFTVYPLS
jgi:hypothetical protein